MFFLLSEDIKYEDKLIRQTDRSSQMYAVHVKTKVSFILKKVLCTRKLFS